MRVKIPSIGKTITLPDGTPQADIEEAVDMTVKSYTPKQGPPSVTMDVSPEKVGMWDKIFGVVQEAAAGVNAGADSLHLKLTGRHSENFQRNAQYWRDKAAANGIDSDSLIGKVAEGAGSVPAALPEWMPSPAGVAAGVALSASGGYNETNPETGQKGGVKGAAIAAGKHLALRGIFQVINAIPISKTIPNLVQPVVKPAAMGGVMAGDAAISGGDAKDITAAAILGTALPLMTHALESGKAKTPGLKETLEAKGVPSEIAKEVAAKAEKIDTTDPRNVELLTEQLDRVVEVTREMKPAEKPVEPDPEYVPFKFTPEERAAIHDEVSKIVKKDGTLDPDMESLINLTRVEGTDRQLAVHQAIGESVRAKVEERLGKDSGHLEEIQNRVYEEIIKRNGHDTGMDFLKKGDRASVDLQRLAVESQVVREMAAKYVKEADRYAELANKNNATEEDILLYHYYNEQARNFVGLDAEIARQQSWALNARKIEATGNTVEVNDLTHADLAGNPALMDMLRTELAKSGGLDAVKKMAEVHIKAADLPEKIALIKKTKNPSILNVVLEFRGLDLLGSLWGRARDTVHNVLRPLTDDIEHSLAAGISKVRGREGADAITFAETAARFVGDWKGTMEAVTRTFDEGKKLPSYMRNMDSPHKMLYESIEHAERYIDNAGFLHGKTKAVLEGVGRKYIRSDYIKETPAGKVADAFIKGLGDIVGKGDSVRSAIWKTVDLAGSVGRSTIYGAIKFTDLPSEYMGYNSEVYGLATKTAVERGLTGKARDEFIASVVTRAKALRDDIKLPNHVTRTDRTVVKEIHEAGMKAALRRTLKDEFESQYAKDMEGFINNSSAGKLAKLVFNQFFSTTARLVKYEAQRNIVTTWASKGMRDSLLGRNGKRAQDLATAKIIFGSMAQSAAIALVTQGVLVGFTNNKKEARDAGVLEYALNVDGRLYQINQVDPYGGFLTSVAAAMYSAQETRNEGITNRFMSGTAALINDRLGRSWLKSLLDLKQAASDNTGKGWMKYLQNYGSTLMPMSGLITSTKDMFGNSEVKAADTFRDRVMKVYAPGALDTEPDLYGKSRTSDGRFWGVRTSDPKYGSARLEILKHNIKIPEAPDVLTLIPGSKFGYAIDDAGKREYMRMLADPTLPIQMEKRLQWLVDSPNYKAAKTEIQEALLKQIVDYSHQMAKGLMWKKPGVIEAARQKANAIGALYRDDTNLNYKGNWFEFLTGKQDIERHIMNDNGLKRKE